MLSVCLLAAGLALLGTPGARRWGPASLVALALGMAAAGRAPDVAAAPAFVAVNTGLLLLGLGLGVAGLAAGARSGGRIERAGTVVGMIGAILVSLEMLPALRRAEPLIAVAAAAGVGTLGGGIAVLARRLRPGPFFRARARPRLPDPRGGALLVLAAATGALAAAGHIAILIAGAIVIAWSAWLALPSSSRPWPVAPLTASLLLAAGLWLVTTIAGPEGLSLAAVPWLPLSPPAERLLAAWLLGAAWAFSGLWPLRQPVDGVLTAPVGAWLIVRLGVPAVTAGLEHWRAAAVPLVLLGLWHAAVTRRLTALAIGGAFLGVASVRPAGVSGAGWLLACAAGLELQRLLNAETARRLEPGVRMLLAFAAAWGAQQVLTAGLDTEVVYSVFAAIAAVFGLRGSCHESSACDGRAALTPPRAGSIFGAEMR